MNEHQIVCFFIRTLISYFFQVVVPDSPVNTNAVKRWEVNATYRAALRTCFHNHLNYSYKKHKHPDFNSPRIKNDHSVQDILIITSTTFIDPLIQPLLSISTGIMASEKVSNDMLSAFWRGFLILYKR